MRAITILGFHLTGNNDSFSRELTLRCSIPWYVSDGESLDGDPMATKDSICIGDVAVISDGRRIRIRDVGAMVSKPNEDVRRARIVIRGDAFSKDGDPLGEGWAYADTIIGRSD